MTHVGIISKELSAYLVESVFDNRFLYFLLVALVGGSILSVNRKVLIKSIVGYIPVILAGIAGAMLTGVLGGLVFGIAGIAMTFRPRGWPLWLSLVGFALSCATTLFVTIWLLVHG